METGLLLSSVCLDKTFSLHDCGIYQLLVHYDGSILTYGVLDPNSQVIIVLGRKEKPVNSNHEAFLKLEFQSNEILSQEYKHAALSISGMPDTLIPTSFFESSKSNDLFKFSSGKTNEKIASVSISKLKATLIHSENTQLSSLFLNKHPYGKMFHNSGLLIESVLRSYRYDKTENIIVDIRSASFDLFAMKEGRLELYNQFEMESENDLLYHIINTAQQLEFDMTKTTVHLSGTIEEDSATYQLLKEYIKNIELNLGLDKYEFGLSLSTINKYNYMSLLNLSVCV